MPNRFLTAAALAALISFAAPLGAQAVKPIDASQPAADAARTPIAEPEPKQSRTRHEVRIAGETIRYTATVGWLIMKDDAGKPVARFGYTAYTRDDSKDPARRPV